MAYEKQTWNNGDVISADKLNHMEDGIAEGGGGTGESSTDKFVVEFSDTSANHTFAEIKQAYDDGLVIKAHTPVSGGELIYQLSTVSPQSIAFVNVTNTSNNIVYFTSYIINNTNTVTRVSTTLTA